MDFFYVRAKPSLLNELREILTFYDYKIDLEKLDPTTDNYHNCNIVRHKKLSNGTSTWKKYDTIESFLLNEVFYKTKRNLRFSPVQNPGNHVANWTITILDVIRENSILQHLLNNDSPFRPYVTKVSNFGTFFRFAENKAQRLYWNPPLNAGLPLSAKKCGSYEAIFAMHDFGHLLLPDLVFTGHVSKLSKQVSVCWRLLGESLTLTLNEMFLPDFLKNYQSFIDGLSVAGKSPNDPSLVFGYDKPYKLFMILSEEIRNGNLYDNHDQIRCLFKAAFKYFYKQSSEDYLELIDKTKENWESVWTDFHNRYLPISMRGREWTEDNFDAIEKMKDEYSVWWSAISKHEISDLKLRLLNDMEELILEKCPNPTDNDIMDIMFDLVWKEVISPLFTKQLTVEHTIENTCETSKILAFKRYMFGNIFLLTKYNSCDHTTKMILDLLDSLPNKDSDKIISEIYELYQNAVLDLFHQSHITLNEYHNYKNIYFMIPPNILRKDDY
jgi:hypothetical protein